MAATTLVTEAASNEIALQPISRCTETTALIILAVSVTAIVITLILWIPVGIGVSSAGALIATIEYIYLSRKNLKLFQARNEELKTLNGTLRENIKVTGVLQSSVSQIRDTEQEVSRLVQERTAFVTEEKRSLDTQLASLREATATQEKQFQAQLRAKHTELETQQQLLTQLDQQNKLEAALRLEQQEQTAKKAGLLEQLTADNTRLSKENTTLTEQISELKTTTLAAQETTTKLSQVEAAATRTEAGFRKINSELQIRLTQITKEHEEIQLDLKKQKQTAAEAATAQKNSFEETTAQLKQQFERLHTETAQLQAQLKHAEDQSTLINKLQTELTSKNETIEKLLAQNAELQKQLSKYS